MRKEKRQDEILKKDIEDVKERLEEIEEEINYNNIEISRYEDEISDCEDNIRLLKCEMEELLNRQKRGFQDAPTKKNRNLKNIKLLDV